MNYIIFDLEATCWEHRGKIENMEIIEIGAVKLESASFNIIDEFQSFVKPINNPVLSDFCIKLTSITQQQIDTAKNFNEVFPNFINWIGGENFQICSWGEYDLNQLKADCTRHSIKLPGTIEKNHRNLKAEFAAFFNQKPCGMKRALKHLKINSDGIHHRGIDDARNIAKIAIVLFSKKAVSDITEAI